MHWKRLLWAQHNTGVSYLQAVRIFQRRILQIYGLKCFLPVHHAFAVFGGDPERTHWTCSEYTKGMCCASIFVYCYFCYSLVNAGREHRNEIIKLNTGVFCEPCMNGCALVVTFRLHLISTQVQHLRILFHCCNGMNRTERNINCWRSAGGWLYL